MNTNWPYDKLSISDILDKETIAVIESGCSERLGRPLMILDFDQNQKKFIFRIDTINPKQNHEAFCIFLRRDDLVQGGETACRIFDIEQAIISFTKYNETGNPLRLFSCYMGLVDMTCVIDINHETIALLFSGQYLPPNGIQKIHGIVNSLGEDSNPKIIIDSNNKKILNGHATELLPLPLNPLDGLKKEADFIKRYAQIEFEHMKREKEQEFLVNLRKATITSSKKNLKQIQSVLGEMIKSLCGFCNCSYGIVFGGTRENTTILKHLASHDLPSELEINHIQFNWIKAKLPLKDHLLDSWLGDPSSQNTLTYGFRDDKNKFSMKTGCIIPISMGDLYRCVIVFGPFQTNVDLIQERSFLLEVANIIGIFALISIEMLYLEDERNKWKKTVKVLNHEYKTALTPILAKIGRVRLRFAKGNLSDINKMDVLLKQAEDLGLVLAKLTNVTLQGYNPTIGIEDLEIERFPLSDLIIDCASGFFDSAEEKKIQLVIDRTIVELPSGDIDVARFTIALANLIENAIKYSFKKSKIFIRSKLDWSNKIDNIFVHIQIDDLGYEIKNGEKDQIFEFGKRGSLANKSHHLPGSGYGLWEARAIIEAHRGSITTSTFTTSIQRQEGKAERVIFSIRFPLYNK